MVRTDTGSAKNGITCVTNRILTPFLDQKFYHPSSAMGLSSAALFLSILCSIPFRSLSLIPVSVINLEHDTNRWNEVSTELTSKGVDNIQRMPAIYGKNLSLHEIRTNTTQLARVFCTKAMIGCYLSHRNFWEQTLKGSSSSQMILEDDVQVSDDFCQKVEQAMEILETSEESKDTWDVLILGAFGSVNPQGRRGIHDVNSLVVGGSRKHRDLQGGSSSPNLRIFSPRRPFGTQAYILSKRGAQKLLEKAWYASNHVDCVIWGIQELNIYCCDPMLAHQNMNTDSTIGGSKSLLQRLIPDNLLVDDYSKVTVSWALGEPIIQIPGLGVLTIGGAIVTSVASALVGLNLGSAKWTKIWYSIQTGMTAALVFLMRMMSRPVGREEALV